MDWKTKLKHEFEVNPVQTIAVGALAATAASKLLNAIVNTRNSRTWAKEVNRRAKKSK